MAPRLQVCAAAALADDADALDYRSLVYTALAAVGIDVMTSPEEVGGLIYLWGRRSAPCFGPLRGFRARGRSPGRGHKGLPAPGD